MNVIKPHIYIVSPIDGDDILRRIEDSGRICYRSESKGNPKKFVMDRLVDGHDSILEHVYFTFDIICDRGVSHELVRHRIASYSQESTRYVNYGKEDIDFIEMIELEPGSAEYAEWHHACRCCETSYKRMLAKGASAQTARSVLNNSVATKIRMTINARSLRNLLSLRCGRGAHPHMKEIMTPLLMFLKDRIPVLFDDIWYDEEFECRHDLLDMDYVSFKE